MVGMLMGVCLVRVNRHDDHLTMSHPTFGNHLIGKSADMLGLPFQQRHLKATAVVEMHMQAGERQVVMIVKSTR